MNPGTLERPPANLVFLLDISGSMEGADRLPMVQDAMCPLVMEYLEAQDSVAIVTYSNDAYLTLESTPCTPANKTMIVNVINGLYASGSTHASAGLSMAYEQAEANLIENGANRIILASDGDFNVGITSQPAFIDFITDHAANGVALTPLGFGMGNLRDDLMESIADNGNGNYAYIDTLEEARRVLVQEAQATLITIAKDVKFQVEFNPDFVEQYRLIGYENRRLEDHQFNDDSVDAGEMGAGHTVTALYELIMLDSPTKAAPGMSWLEQRLGSDRKDAIAADTDAIVGDVVSIVDLRYKQPDSAISTWLYYLAEDLNLYIEEVSNDYRFSAAVAALGMLVRGSAYSGNATYDSVYWMGEGGLGGDEFGLRAEFLELVKRAESISGR